MKMHVFMNGPVKLFLNPLPFYKDDIWLLNLDTRVTQGLGDNRRPLKY